MKKEAVASQPVLSLTQIFGAAIGKMAAFAKHVDERTAYGGRPTQPIPKLPPVPAPASLPTPAPKGSGRFRMALTSDPRSLGAAYSQPASAPGWLAEATRMPTQPYSHAYTQPYTHSYTPTGRQMNRIPIQQMDLMFDQTMNVIPTP